MDIWSSEDDKSVHARFMKRLIVRRAVEKRSARKSKGQKP